MRAVKPLVVRVATALMLSYAYTDAGASPERVPSWADLTDEAYMVEELEGRGYQVDRENGTVWAPEGCYYLPLEGVSEETVVETRQSLVAQGWYSDPTDSMEVLYSPSCRVSEQVMG